MPLEILKLGHPLLRQIAAEVLASDISELATQCLIDDMIETMRAASGAGLAAPQVGQAVRICVAEVKDNPRYPAMQAISLRVWINPQIEVLAPFPRVEMYEGCLSVPGMRGRVSRPGNIRVTSLDRQGNAQVDEFLGACAAVVQHEVDHLDGILFIDRADDTTLCFQQEFETFVPDEQRLIIVER